MSDDQSNDSYASALSPNSKAIQRFPILSRQECYCLQSSDGKDFAVLHSRTAAALQTLQDLPSIRLEAVLESDNSNKPYPQPKKGKKAVLSISIDLYGSGQIAQEVGKRLSKARTYLQHPVCLKNNVPYNNPHYYALPGVQGANLAHISPSSEREKQGTSSVDIAKVFEEIEHTRQLASRNADLHIKTPLLQYVSFLESCDAWLTPRALRLDTKRKAYVLLCKERRRLLMMISLYGRHTKTRAGVISEQPLPLPRNCNPSYTH